MEIHVYAQRRIAMCTGISRLGCALARATAEEKIYFSVENKKGFELVRENEFLFDFSQPDYGDIIKVANA